jgi:hypothetical protein
MSTPLACSQCPLTVESVGTSADNERRTYVTIAQSRHRFDILQIEAATDASVHLYDVCRGYRFDIVLVIENGLRIPNLSERFNSLAEAESALEALITKPDNFPPGSMTYDTSTGRITTRYRQ